MKASQKAASRRLTSRYALVSAVATSLEGLPVSVKDSGSLAISEEITDSQFDEIARTITTLSSQSTTLYNFAKGDLWNAAVTRYCGGRNLIRRLFTDPDVIEKQCVAWRNFGSIARKVPLQDRDMSRLWSYYRYEYGREDCRLNSSGISEATKRNFHVSGNEEFLTVSYDEANGKHHEETFPYPPIRKHVLRQCLDPLTGELDFGEDLFGDT